MRCLNCHTALMESDVECPSCRSPISSATAAPPDTIQGSSGLLNLLPIFGGALGGLAYAALANPETHVARGSSRSGQASRSTGPLKWLCGLAVAGLGFLFVVLALVNGIRTWQIAQRPAEPLSAADLQSISDYKSAPPWIEFDFQESKSVGVSAKRKRLGNAGEVQAKALLVRVDDQWLVAAVPPGFTGRRLVGRLQPAVPYASQSLIEAVRNREPTLPLLPFEFNAIEGSVSDQRVRYTAAGILGVLGMLGLCLGAWLCSHRRPPPQTATAAALSVRSALPIAATPSARR